MQVQSVRDPVYLAALEARFAVAARHSRLVRFLRRAIPLMIMVTSVGLIAISIFNPFRLLAKLPVDIGNVVVSGTSLTMESPHMAGFTPDRRRYELWASTARQNIADPSNVELQTLKAQVEMEDKSIVTMNAKQGVFNNKTQILNLQESIHLKSSTGYEAQLTEATIDMNNGSVVSEKPVAVKLLNGDLRSQRLEITGNGALVTFEGNVSMDLVMDGPDDSSSKDSSSKAARSK